MDASIFGEIGADVKDDLRIYCFEMYLFINGKITKDNVVGTEKRKFEFSEEFGNSLLRNWETHAKRFRNIIRDDFPRYDQKLDNFVRYVMIKTKEILQESTYNVDKDLEIVTVFLYETYVRRSKDFSGSSISYFIEVWGALFLKFFFKRYNKISSDSKTEKACSPAPEKSKAKSRPPDKQESKEKACPPDSRKSKAKACSPDSEESKAKACSPDSEESKAKACSPDSEESKAKACPPDSRKSKAKACSSDSRKYKTKACSSDLEEAKARAFSPDSKESKAKACPPNLEESKAKACSSDSRKSKAKAGSLDSEESKTRAFSPDLKESKAKACSPESEKCKATNELDSSCTQTTLIEEKFTDISPSNCTIKELKGIEDICSLASVVENGTTKVSLHEFRNYILERIKKNSKLDDEVFDIFNDAHLTFRREEIPDSSDIKDDQHIKKAQCEKEKKEKKK